MRSILCVNSSFLYVSKRQCWMNLLMNMDSLFRYVVFGTLIVLSRQEALKKPVNYEPILEKMQTSSSEVVLVYERYYEELVVKFMDDMRNLRWYLLHDDTGTPFSDPEYTKTLTSLGVDHVVAVGTSAYRVEVILVTDKPRFYYGFHSDLESLWASSTSVQFCENEKAMARPPPCFFDTTIKDIAVVIENSEVAHAETTVVQWRYKYLVPPNGESEFIKFSRFDEQSRKWQEVFNNSVSFDKITVGVVNNEVFFKQPSVIDVSASHIGMISQGNGLEYKLIDYLGKRTNISFAPKMANLKAVDATTKETWQALITQLDNNEIDLAIAKIPATNELLEKYAYSSVYFTEHYYILSRTFSSSDYMFAVFQPLQLKVWTLLLLLLFLCGPLFLIMVYFTRKPDSVFTFNAKGLENSYFHTYRLFFGHATWNHHFCFSFNLFVLTWLCVGLMLIVGYNSTFTASISSGKSKWEINDLKDLLHGIQMGYVTLVLNKNLDGRGPFKASSIRKNSIYAKIIAAASRRNKVRYINLQAENLPQLVGENDAIVADLTTSYFLLRKLKDKDFRISHQSIGTDSYVLFARQGFRHFDKFDVIIRELYEFGSFMGWYNTEIKGKNRNQFQGNTIDGTVMQLEHIYGAFLVYCVGVGLAVFMLLSEVLYKRCKTRVNQTNACNSQK